MAAVVAFRDFITAILPARLVIKLQTAAFRWSTNDMLQVGKVRLDLSCVSTGRIGVRCYTCDHIRTTPPQEDSNAGYEPRAGTNDLHCDPDS